MAVDFPNLFIPFGSVNPYRSDALEELERCAQCGVKVIKWLVSRRSCHGVGQISGFRTEEMGSLGIPSSPRNLKSMMSCELCVQFKRLKPVTLTIAQRVYGANGVQMHLSSCGIKIQALCTVILYRYTA